LFQNETKTELRAGQTSTQVFVQNSYQPSTPRHEPAKQKPLHKKEHLALQNCSKSSISNLQSTIRSQQFP